MLGPLAQIMIPANLKNGLGKSLLTKLHSVFEWSQSKTFIKDGAILSLLQASN
jgi:hypothetical protein